MEITSQHQIYTVKYRGETCVQVDTLDAAVAYVRDGVDEAGNWRVGYDITVQEVVEIRSAPAVVEFELEED